MAFEPLFNTSREQCPLPDDRLIEAANTGMLPLSDRNGVKIVVAPRLVDSRRLVAVATSGADMARRIRLTSTARLHDFVARHSAHEIERRAVDELRTAHPELSAGVGRPRRMVTLAVSGAAPRSTAFAAPGAALTAAEIMLGAVFLAWTGLRLFGLLSERFVRRRPRTFSDGRLPIYSIVVALYREAAAVPDLVAALRALDYPLEKLDIKLVLEPDDHETREAVASLQLGPPFEIMIAPDHGPRTKPKALNAALPFVARHVRRGVRRRGPAGARPASPARSRPSSPTTSGSPACRRGSPSTTPRIAGSTRLFTAEYAGLFDVFLPGLAAWRLPLPLGGSSNHFRTAVLRRGRRLGSLQRHRGCRPRHAARALRLSHRGHSPRPPTRRRRRASAPGCGSARAGSRAGCRPGWCTCARRSGWCASSACRASLVFQLLVGGTVLAALIHVLFAARLDLDAGDRTAGATRRSGARWASTPSR